MVIFSSNDTFWILLFKFSTIHLELKRQIRLYAPVVPLKTIGPIYDHNGQNLYPFSDQIGSKIIPFGAAHTHIAYVGEYLPGCYTNSILRQETTLDMFELGWLHCVWPRHCQFWQGAGKYQMSPVCDRYLFSSNISEYFPLN